jgi:hypothetical protein
MVSVSLACLCVDFAQGEKQAEDVIAAALAEMTSL